MSKILKEIASHKDLKKAVLLSRFFKTGKGQYGEGDIFWGLTVPISRKIAIKHKDISVSEILKLLENKVHEVRIIGIYVLVHKYKISSLKEKKSIVDFYLKNTKYINNWDLVDTSAPYILGDYLLDKKPVRSYKSVGASVDRSVLYKLVNSKNLWEERIAIISTFPFIKKGEFKDTLKICEILMNHKHDLIHKACGWMLREVGKKDEKVLKKFLDKNIFIMPRTMLRYAIEKFPEKIRKKYLGKK